MVQLKRDKTVQGYVYHDEKPIEGKYRVHGTDGQSKYLVKWDNFTIIGFVD